MGTNYYWYKKSPCICCGRPYEPLHIGKSSGGWCFSLHVIPEEGINDLPDWEELWTVLDSKIKDEYGREILPSEMLENIIDRGRDKPPSDDFDYERNYAVPGPNNLARHKLDGKHCVKHGNGTWDCITGEFS